MAGKAERTAGVGDAQERRIGVVMNCVTAGAFHLAGAGTGVGLEEYVY